MKRILILYLLFGPAFSAFAQKTVWVKTSGWKIYNIRDSRAFFYSPDTLQTFASADLGDSAIRGFLKNSSPIDSANTPVWMGLYKATCVFASGETHRIDVSVYGGFFYDEEQKKYYQLGDEKKEEWLGYFLERMKAFSN